MAIQKFNFSEPFFQIKLVYKEETLPIEEKSIVINLDKTNLWVKEQPLGFLKSTILRNIKIKDVKHAILIEDYEKYSDDTHLFDEIKSQWRMIYEMTQLDRHKGLPLWRSPKERVDNIELNLCFISAGTDSGPHKEHTPPFVEVHTQILGYGKMQKFEENNLETLYQEVILAPGNTHDPFFDNDIIYPWHQYHSVTDAVYMPIEIFPVSG